jgi:hypothetical protein
MKKLLFAGILFLMAGVVYSTPPDEGYVDYHLLSRSIIFRLMKEKGF